MNRLMKQLRLFQIKTIFGAIGKPDETLHGGDETLYVDVAENFESALLALNKMTAK